MREGGRVREGVVHYIRSSSVTQSGPALLYLDTDKVVGMHQWGDIMLPGDTNGYHTTRAFLVPKSSVTEVVRETDDITTSALISIQKR